MNGNTDAPVLLCSINKAGMETVDRDKVNNIILEASKGTPYFEYEKKRTECVRKKAQELRQIVLTTEKPSNGSKKIALQKQASMILHSLGDMNEKNIFLHIDLDMFFCAVEALDDPSLTNRPFVVGTMSMISTANYLARRCGIRAGMPGFIALKLCPTLLIISPCHEKYAKVAKTIRQTLEKYDPLLRMTSCDEASLCLNEFLKSHVIPSDDIDMMNKTILTIRQAVQKATRGLTCSAGVAFTRSLAKICSNENKPNGQFLILNKKDHEAFLDRLPIEKVSGIGRRKQQLLQEGLDINLCRDIRIKAYQILQCFSRKTVLFLFRSCLGLDSTTHDDDKTQDHDNLQNKYADRSIGCEQTFVPTNALNELHEHIEFLAKHLHQRLEKKNLQCFCINIKIKFQDFSTRQMSYRFPYATNDSNIFVQTSRKLLKQIHYAYQLYKNKKFSGKEPSLENTLCKIRLIGIRAERLIWAQCSTTPSLSPLLNLLKSKTFTIKAKEKSKVLTSFKHCIVVRKTHKKKLGFSLYKALQIEYFSMNKSSAL